MLFTMMDKQENEQIKAVIVTERAVKQSARRHQPELRIRKLTMN